MASRNHGLRIVVGCAVLFPLVLVYLFWNKAEPQRFTSPSLDTQKWNSFDSVVQMRPTTDLRNGTDIIWQIPDLPKAVLFLAHGCDGKAVNFWDKSPECPNCVGLPEERLIALHALARRFAVVSVSSKRRCWSFRDEVAEVKDILNWWIEKQRLEKLPLVALGASSGGYFVSVLAGAVEFSSIAIMIAEGRFELIDVKQNYPATLFVHMPKDVTRRIMITRYMDVLRHKGVRVSELQCKEFPLSPEFFSDRIPGLDPSVSVKLFELFRRKGFIDDNGYMRKDGRRTRWRETVREDKSILLDERLEPPVEEEMNLAYALHEMTSVYTDQIFKWFESHIS